MSTLLEINPTRHPGGVWPMEGRSVFVGREGRKTRGVHPEGHRVPLNAPLGESMGGRHACRKAVLP
jgi:hypothetical protein